MVHRWNSGVFYRGSCNISKLCYINANSVCSLDCDSDSNYDGQIRGTVIVNYIQQFRLQSYLIVLLFPIPNYTFLVIHVETFNTKRVTRSLYR